MLFTKSYLSLARIGLEELENEKYIRKIQFEYDYCYKNKLLLIPVLYNIQHAIELIVKSLGVSIDKTYLFTHNKEDLIQYFKDTMPKIDKKNKVEKLVELIYKYYKCEFWNKKIIKNSSVTDCQNDIFRFPDNSAKFNLNLEIFKGANLKETKELLEDIKKLCQILNTLNSQIHRNNKVYKKFISQPHKAYKS